MDNKFTLKLQQWLLTPDDQKDWDKGALMLLQLTNNKIMYRNICGNPKAKSEYIKGKLQQHLNFRLEKKTHAEVEEMQKKVDVIAKKTIKPESEFADFKAGKRADHDALPDEIQARYVENLNIVHRMRELHLQLRKISNDNVTCPDSERYPFLKELIALDKQIHENWDVYDHYVVQENVKTEPVPENKEEEPEEKPKKVSKSKRKKK